LLRWHSGDPLIEAAQESWTPYQFGFDNTVRYEDASGQCSICPSWSQIVDFSNGVTTALADNANPLPSNYQERNAEGRDPSSYNGGLRVGNVLSLIQAGGEMIGGAFAATGGTLATAGSAGTASPVSVPAALAGGALFLHGGRTGGKAIDNLVRGPRATDQNGRVNANVAQNQKQGIDFENKVNDALPKAGYTDVANQVTVRPNGKQANGKPFPRVRLDNLARNPAGEVVLIDAKSSATAQLTKNQKISYPALLKNGGTVLGNNGAGAGYNAGF
jgi:hypothetical protein